MKKNIKQFTNAHVEDEITFSRNLDVKKRLILLDSLRKHMTFILRRFNGDNSYPYNFEKSKMLFGIDDIEEDEDE